MKKKTCERYKRISVNNRKIDEHRYVMEQHLGRYLQSWEVVRHLNDNTKDNRLENLYLTNKKRVPYEQLAEGKLHIPTAEAQKRGLIKIAEIYGRPVMILDINSNELMSVKSVGVAARIICASKGNVTDVLRGRKRQTHGFILKYIKDNGSDMY